MKALLEITLWLLLLFIVLSVVRMVLGVFEPWLGVTITTGDYSPTSMLKMAYALAMVALMYTASCYLTNQIWKRFIAPLFDGKNQP